jgi:integrase
MSVVKSKRDGVWDVYVYDPVAKRNRYVGRRKLERDAKKLFRDKTTELAEQKIDLPQTCTEWATTWLDVHHGPGTRRPAPSTLTNNEQLLRSFLADFGARRIDGGIARSEALAWAKRHPQNAKAVSAMFNDAIDGEACETNPFRHRRQQQARGRQDIYPLTEEEVDRLAGIALEHWGGTGYGLIAKAWVLFGAWVGTRPGETFRVEPGDLDFHAGLVRVTRVKGRKQTEWIVLPTVVQDAIRAMPGLPSRGPLFPTLHGTNMARKGALSHYWTPIRAAFRETVTLERWAELVRGQSDKRSFDFYSCRHFCASIIVDRGGNEYDVAQQLGNTPEVCREVYVHGYRDRVNDRNRERLEGPGVVSLSRHRAERAS